MALSQKAKRGVELALVSKELGKEVAEAIEASAQAEEVAEIADTSAADAEEVGEKVNEILAALKAAGLMQS
jgi:hypothetical protein